MSERRRGTRQKSFLNGLVYVDKRRGAMNCLVRDLSEVGARIVFSGAVTLPRSFSLHIPQREQTFHAEVQWRRGDEIGLAFTPAGAAGAAGATARETELMDRVAQLEAELTTLRRTLKQLKRSGSGGDTEAA
jgi:PilZ domain